MIGLDKPWGFQETEALRFQDNQHMKVVRLSALRTSRLYHPTKYSWYSFLLEAESTPAPQCSQNDHIKRKIPVTPSGTEPATFWLVAQCLNQLHHHMPPRNLCMMMKMIYVCSHTKSWKNSLFINHSPNFTLSNLNLNILIHVLTSKILV